MHIFAFVLTKREEGFMHACSICWAKLCCDEHAHMYRDHIAVFRWSVLQNQLNSGCGCGVLRIDGNGICVVF